VTIIYQIQSLLLGQHADLLLRRWQEICETPHFFHAFAGRCHVNLIPDREIPLGVLVHLWHIGELATLCPYCGGLLLIYDLSGSVLSGSHDWQGACRGCQRSVGRREVPRQQEPDFVKLWQPLRAELAEHRNEREVEPGQRPKFSWKQGLVGERTPDRVIRPRIDPAPLAAVVDVLRGGPGRVAVRWPAGEVAFWFDWARRTLRTADGAVVLRLADDWVLDRTGALVWTWDSLYLRRPDGSIEYELTQRSGQGPRGGRFELAAKLAGRARELYWRTFAGPFDGRDEYEIRLFDVCDTQGAALIGHDDEIPIPVALWAARTCQTHRP
jgi:hypothetical protein